jgi:hypothetical protein
MVVTAPEPVISSDVDSNSLLTVTQNIIVLTTVSLLVIAFICVTAYIVRKRGEIQPLKIRSSKLLFVSVIANLMIVV